MPKIMTCPICGEVVRTKINAETCWLKGKTEPIDFSERFDGYTEWRKWDARIPEWFRAVSA